MINREQFNNARSREIARNKFSIAFLTIGTIGLVGILPLEIISEVAKIPDPHPLPILDAILSVSALAGSGLSRVGSRRDRKIMNRWHDPDEYDDPGSRAY